MNLISVVSCSITTVAWLLSLPCRLSVIISFTLRIRLALSYTISASEQNEQFVKPALSTAEAQTRVINPWVKCLSYIPAHWANFRNVCFRKPSNHPYQHRNRCQEVNISVFFFNPSLWQKTPCINNAILLTKIRKEESYTWHLLLTFPRDKIKKKQFLKLNAFANYSRLPPPPGQHTTSNARRGNTTDSEEALPRLTQLIEDHADLARPEHVSSFACIPWLNPRGKNGWKCRQMCDQYAEGEGTPSWSCG